MELRESSDLYWSSPRFRRVDDQRGDLSSPSSYARTLLRDLKTSLMQLNRKRLFRFIPLCVFILAFSAYLSTLSPTVSFIDSGELTAVSYTLGIAHPTGYPVHTLLGRLFTLIPTGEVAWRLNLASSLFAPLPQPFFL